MANHKSAEKRIRTNEKRRVLNRYQLVTTRTLVKKLRKTTTKAEAEPLYKLASAALDKLAKRNIIHKNNAANKKSKLAKHVNKLAA